MVKKFYKKAQVETQFNWIFILIAGAVILIFFVGVVMRQRASSEVKISETVMTDLESIFVGGSVSTGTSQLIETPRIEIGFDCANYYLKGVTKPTENLIIFAPNLVQGRNILTWTLDYNLPYKITNFLYITTPEMRYIFVSGDDRWLRMMNQTLPEEMNKEFIKIDSTNPYNPDDIKDKNNYKVRIIFDGDKKDPVPSELEYMGQDLTALAIKSSDMIEFYKSNGILFERPPDHTETYTADMAGQLLTPTLYGAIFTDDVEIYNCMMGKALKRAYFVSRVYAERNRNISNYFDDTKSYCNNFKLDPGEFDGFVSSIGLLYPTFQTNPQPVEHITGAAAAMIEKNKVLLQKSCPLIY